MDTLKCFICCQMRVVPSPSSNPALSRQPSINKFSPPWIRPDKICEEAKSTGFSPCLTDEFPKGNMWCKLTVSFEKYQQPTKPNSRINENYQPRHKKRGLIWQKKLWSADRGAKWAFGSWAKTGRANVLNAPNRPFLLHVVDFFSLMHFFWLSLCRKMSNPFRWRLRFQDYSLNIHLKCSVFMHLVIRFDISERKTSYPIYGKIQ